MRLNPKWTAEKLDAMNHGRLIDETLECNMAAKWLIAALSHRNKTFSVYNIGAGVKRITTDSTTCPCCKRKL